MPWITEMDTARNLLLAMRHRASLTGAAREFVGLIECRLQSDWQGLARCSFKTGWPARLH